MTPAATLSWEQQQLGWMVQEGLEREREREREGGREGGGEYRWIEVWGEWRSLLTSVSLWELVCIHRPAIGSLQASHSNTGAVNNHQPMPKGGDMCAKTSPWISLSGPHWRIHDPLGWNLMLGGWGERQLHMCTNLPTATHMNTLVSSHAELTQYTASVEILKESLFQILR